MNKSVALLNALYRVRSFIITCLLFHLLSKALPAIIDVKHWWKLELEWAEMSKEVENTKINNGMKHK